MGENYRALRKVYDSIYANVAESLQPYLHSLDFFRQNEIKNNMNVNGLGHGFPTLRQNFGTYDRLNSFDLFYYINGQFLLTIGGHLYMPDGEKPDEVKGEKLSTKKLYKKFIEGATFMV